MGELINLRRIKKSAERSNAAKAAEINRAKFGRNKAKKAHDARAKKKASDTLDSHRIGEESSS